MHRLDRRLRILSGKRSGAFDPGQYALEAAVRARVARAVRASLRQHRPVQLVTPRWSDARHFLEDIAGDLRVGYPEIMGHVLDLEPLHQLSLPGQWTALTGLLVDGLEVSPSRTGPIRQPVDRVGFRNALRAIFEVVSERRAVLLMAGAQHLAIETWFDLAGALTEHRQDFGFAASPNLVLAGPVAGRELPMDGARTFVLPDYGSMETMEVLVEYCGLCERATLRRLAELSGGVPQLVHALGASFSKVRLDGSEQRVREVLAGQLEEVRGAVGILRADEDLGRRLEQLAEADEPLAWDEVLDTRLALAGLVRREGSRAALRSPLYAPEDAN